MTASPDAAGEAEERNRPAESTSVLQTGSIPLTNERISTNASRENLSRSIEQIDRDEIMAAIREVFSSSEPLDSDTAISNIARVLGFRRTGNRIREELRSALRTAIRRHIITREKGIITIECANIDDYSRDELIEALLATIGSIWWEREDAIRAAARRLGFRRTGRRITQAFKSAINGAIRRRLLEFDKESIRRCR